MAEGSSGSDRLEVLMEVSDLFILLESLKNQAREELLVRE